MTSRKDMKELQRVLLEEQCRTAGYVGSANSDNQGAFSGMGGVPDVVDQAAADLVDKHDFCSVEVEDDDR